MAVVLVNSAIIAAYVASPKAFVPVGTMGGAVRVQKATVEIASSDSIASIYRMFRVKSNDSLIRLDVFCDAITSAAADVGLYQSAEYGSAVVDVDCYASAVSLATAITVGTNIRFEAGAAGGDVANVLQLVHQDAAITVDPQRGYDIAFTLTAAATAAGTLTAILTYTENN